MSIKIALAGNPNCGKTTLFNALTGSNQFVGNWPGVTVEKKEGKLKGEKDVIITDLPGIYSLSPYTLEEVVARNYLITEKPDEVSRMVMEDLDRGITGISAKGMYSGQDKLMLFCVVGKKELVHLKEMIDEMMEQADKLLGGCQK